MITEHNYPKIWFLEMLTPNGARWLSKTWRPTNCEEDAIQFVDVESANRYAQRFADEMKAVEIELPYLLEFDMKVYWQKQRTYRTEEVALLGFEYYLNEARGTWAGNHLFRLVDVREGWVVTQAQPNTAERKII